MENETKFAIIIFAISLLLPLLLNQIHHEEKTIIKTSFLVGETPGFDLSPNELTFGRLVPNSSASRSVTLSNTLPKKRKISIQVNGEISDYIIASENNFYLNPNESKNITFSVYSTNLEEPKKYQGEIIIISKS